jgi:hypothetical protein
MISRRASIAAKSHSPVSKWRPWSMLLR